MFDKIQLFKISFVVLTEQIYPQPFYQEGLNTKINRFLLQLIRSLFPGLF